MIGQMLGPYRVLVKLGEGGMGEVYRARDTRLNRDVAIKVLPDAFVHDADRLARFKREAQVLASLNHPHIAAIYGLEESARGSALVLELIEGPTLADRIARGPIPVDEALPIARQIAEALEAAHEHGIIHRDLKPANIKLTADDKVKVLDFGLAKAMANDSGSVRLQADLSMSPTITSPAMTMGGVILGTAAYMSPEQAKGKPVDKRCDIWALGCVLFEMLTARRAFAGEDAADVIAAILMKEPDWSLLPAATPASIRTLLRRCLEKDRQRRLDSAADARLEIDDALKSMLEARPFATSPANTAPRKVPSWLIAAMSVLVAGGVFAMLYFRESPRLPEMRMDLAVPPASDLREFALSPDGARLVAAVSTGGQRQLWVRSLKSSTWQPLKGTEGAMEPFWSPQSRSIGFIAGNKLKRIDIDGDGLQTLADARSVGGTWNRDNVIVFAMNTFGPLARISASGGEPLVITKLEGQQTAHMYPSFLPDGKHFLFFSRATPSEQGIYLASLDSAETKMLVAADEGTTGYVAPGWLVFVRQRILRAQHFDLEKLALSGDVLAIASAVASTVSVSTTGLIAYRAASTRHTQLVWTDRRGNSLGTFGPPNDRLLTAPTLSPDERRVAVWSSMDPGADIMLVDSARITGFTFDPAIDRYPIWSPDGNTVVFDSTRQKGRDLYRSSNSGSEERLLATAQAKTANDWSPDGQFILFQSNDPKTGIDLWVLPLGAKREPYVFLRTPYNERRATFSRDGRWVAYLSNESGRYEVFVRAFFDPEGRESVPRASASTWQISNNGGIQPCWSPDGKELFYIGPDGKMMAATITATGSAIEAAAPVALFSSNIYGVDSVDSGLQFAVARDGRFLLNTISVDTAPVTVIVNWSPETPQYP